MGKPGIAEESQLRAENWDLTLFKGFSVTDRAKFQLRLEAFNALNHTNFGAASTYIGETTNASGVTTLSPYSGFGNIYSAGAPRIVQIGGRFEF